MLWFSSHFFTKLALFYINIDFTGIRRNNIQISGKSAEGDKHINELEDDISLMGSQVNKWRTQWTLRVKIMFDWFKLINKR